MPADGVAVDSSRLQAATVPSDAADTSFLEQLLKANPVISPRVSLSRCAQVARHSPWVLKICMATSYCQLVASDQYCFCKMTLQHQYEQSPPADD